MRNWIARKKIGSGYRYVLVLSEVDDRGTLITADVLTRACGCSLISELSFCRFVIDVQNCSKEEMLESSGLNSYCEGDLFNEEEGDTSPDIDLDVDQV